MPDLSTRLKELKIKNNTSQTEIAEAVGLSLRGYQRYERGERDPSSAILQKLADYFDVSTDYLLGRTDDPTRRKKTTAGHPCNRHNAIQSTKGADKLCRHFKDILMVDVLSLLVL